MAKLICEFLQLCGGNMPKMDILYLGREDRTGSGQSLMLIFTVLKTFRLFYLLVLGWLSSSVC